MPRRDEVYATSTPDGTAILHIPSGTITTLNPTGALIWEALRAGKAAEQIARELASRTGADPHMVESDVSSFISQLQSQHLLP